MYCHGCNNPKKTAMNKRNVVVSRGSNGYKQSRNMFFCDDCVLKVDKNNELDAKGCFSVFLMTIGLIASVFVIPALILLLIFFIV